MTNQNPCVGYVIHRQVCTRLDHVVSYHCGYDVHALSINQNGDHRRRIFKVYQEYGWVNNSWAAEDGNKLVLMLLNEIFMLTIKFG